VVHIFLRCRRGVGFRREFFCSSKPESTKRTTAPEVFGWSQLPGNGDGRGPSKSRVSSTSRKSAWLKRSCLRRRGVCRIRDSQHGWQSFRFRRGSWEERKTVDSAGALEKAFDELISNERIKAAERFIENDEAGGGRRGAPARASFIFMPRERALILRSTGKSNCLTRDCSRARSQVG